MKTTNSKIKKYSALALALVIATPISSFAGSIENDTKPSPTIISEEVENQTRQSYITNIELSLLESGKKANYTIHIAGLDNPIKAHIYLDETSNLANIQVSNGEELDTTKTGNLLTFDIEKDGTYTITADIKEDATSRLFFDLGLVDEAKAGAETRRISSFIEENEDKTQTLKKVETNRLESVLTGAIEDDKTITWSDILLNNSNKAISLDYPLNLENNQANAEELLKLSFYQLSPNGFEKINEENLALGDIKGLVIPANGFVKIGFTTQIIDQNQAASARGVVAKETVKSIEEYTEDINGLTHEIENKLIENENIISVKANAEKTDTKPTEVAQKEQTTTEVKEEKLETYEDFTKAINDNTDQIATTLINNEHNLTKDSANAEKVTQTQTEEPTKDTATNQSAEKNQEESNKQTSDLKDIKEVKTVVLTENVGEDGKKFYTIESADKVDFNTLTHSINLLTNQIATTLIENEKNQPASIIANTSQESKTNPVESIKSSSIIPANLTSEREKVDWLIREIQSVNAQIETLLKKSLNNDDRILNKILEKAPTAMVNKDSKDPDTIKEVEEINAELTEVISQLDLALELDEVNSNKAEIEKIAALVENLENLEENSKKALEEVEIATNNQKPHNLVKARFPVVVDGFSEEVLRDLDKVVTVTLDPLTKPEVKSNREDAVRKYPKINEYLNRLNQRDELLNPNN